MPTQKDYYEILGVPRNATEEEIKAAYRRLAKKYHPDVAEDKEKAEKIFREINEAYQVLSDPEKRRLYDMYGHAGLTGSIPGGSYGRQPYTGYSASWTDWGGFEDIFSLFEELVRGVYDSSFTTHRTRRPMTSEEVYDYFLTTLRPINGSNVVVEVSLKLHEILRDNEREVNFSRKRVCSTCKGLGFTRDSIDICDKCGGTGRIRFRESTLWGTLVTETTCDACGGSGFKVRNLCPECQGKRFITEEVRYKVRIPPGVHDGETLRFKGMGNEGLYGGRDGDLLVKVKVEPSSAFKRDGADLIVDLKVSFPEAVLGTTVEFRGIDGEKVRLKVPPGTESGKVIKVHGRGLPRREKPSSRGDLLVKIHIDVPRKLNSQQEMILRQMLELFRPEVRNPALDMGKRGAKNEHGEDRGAGGGIFSKLFKRRRKRKGES